MMDQKKWERLFKAFDEEEPFWENNYAGESDFEDLDLTNWLECDGARPNYRIVKEFTYNGYSVFPVEMDSFGWMIGGVRRVLDPSGKTITFG